MKKKFSWGIPVLGTYVIYLVLVLLGFTRGLHGIDTTALFERNATLVTPMTYAFYGIPVVTVIGLILMIGQLVPVRGAGEKSYEGMQWMLLGSNIVSIIWILTWHFEKKIVAFIAMALLLLFLSLAYMSALRYTLERRRATWMRMILGIWIGQTIFLTVEGLSSVLRFAGMHTESNQLYGVLFLVLATLITLLYTVGQREFLLGLVSGFYMFGVFMRHVLVLRFNFVSVSIISLLMVGILVVSLIECVRKNLDKPKRRSKNRREEGTREGEKREDETRGGEKREDGTRGGEKREEETREEKTRVKEKREEVMRVEEKPDVFQAKEEEDHVNPAQPS